MMLLNEETRGHVQDKAQMAEAAWGWRVKACKTWGPFLRALLRALAVPAA